MGDQVFPTDVPARGPVSGLARTRGKCHGDEIGGATVYGTTPRHGSALVELELEKLTQKTKRGVPQCFLAVSLATGTVPEGSKTKSMMVVRSAACCCQWPCQAT